MTYEDTFLRLYCEHYQRIKQFCTLHLSQCRNSTWIAEDIAQEVFVTAYKNMDTVSTHPYPIRWLFTVARNKCNDYLRNERTHQRILGFPVSYEEQEPAISMENSIEHWHMQMEEYEAKGELKQLLTKGELLVFQEVFEKMRSIPEAAIILNKSQGAVKKTVERIMLKAASHNFFDFVIVFVAIRVFRAIY